MGEKRLLVCDDEAAVGRFIRNATEPLGYDVRLTISGPELMQIYDDFKPTAVLLDMVMPSMDGNEVIMWLAGRGCKARLILMTGYHPEYTDHARILAECNELGAVATLHKPFGVNDLLAALEAG
jgi:CheY-like chemotaxis protein